MVDIADIGLEWRMWLAERGDREPLAEVIDGPLPPLVHRFLANVVAGDIELAPRLPRNKTYRWQVLLKHLRERAVVREVKREMREQNTLRDKPLRTRLTRKWCKLLGTTPELVGEFLKRGRQPSHAEIRRRLSAHASRNLRGT